MKRKPTTHDMKKDLGLPKSIYNEGVPTASNNTPYSFVWKEGNAFRITQ